MIVAIIMTTANVYVGLYAGMTVSASVPAAVIAMGIFRGILRRQSILESNLVQTIASAGESLAAGAIFTLPALVIIGVWQEFRFWPTTLIAVAGGLLGVVFMVPLRRALIVEDKKLTYPEGMACATVLETGSSDSMRGVMLVAKGLIVGAVVKFLMTGLKFLTGTVEYAVKAKDSVFYFGIDISPMLLAVGYIVKLNIAVLVFLGGVIGWVIALPLLGYFSPPEETEALDAARTLWSEKVRYIGVGAMVVGGLASIFSVRTGIASAFSRLAQTVRGDSGKSPERTEKDIPIFALGLLFLGAAVLTFFIYQHLINDLKFSLLITLVMIALAFCFVAVSSYIVGLIGTSNNPVSGMTITTLLASASLFLVLGFQGDSAILATLGVAAVVCCAAAIAGDCSQDLKTGLMVKATPRYQQLGQVIGVVIPAVVIAPVLYLLNSTYGIGGEEGLKAPQATLFASLTEALFGDADLPTNMLLIGAGMGVVILILDAILKYMGMSFRLYLMPVAVGIYLPISLAVPIFLGGVVRFFADKNRQNTEEKSDNGVLLGSGFVAGESIMGVLLALLIFFNLDLDLGIQAWTFVSLAVIAGVAFYLFKVARGSAKAA